MLVYKNAITNHVNTYDYTIDLTLAISFLVLTIFFAVLGFTFFSLRIMEQTRNACKISIPPIKYNSYSRGVDDVEFHERISIRRF